MVYIVCTFKFFFLRIFFKIKKNSQNNIFALIKINVYSKIYSHIYTEVIKVDDILVLL